MRDLTKEMASYAWAVTTFSAQQLASLAIPACQGEEHPATAGFRCLTDATEKQMQGVWRPLFRTGDTVQRWAIDLTLNLLAVDMIAGLTGCCGDRGASRGRSER